MCDEKLFEFVLILAKNEQGKVNELFRYPQTERKELRSMIHSLHQFCYPTSHKSSSSSSTTTTTKGTTLSNSLPGDLPLDLASGQNDTNNGGSNEPSEEEEEEEEEEEDDDDGEDVLKTERFSFVLTDAVGKRYYGYVQRDREGRVFGHPTACVILSACPCFALFSHMQRELFHRRARERRRCGCAAGNDNEKALVAMNVSCQEFLKAVIGCPVPAPGASFEVPAWTNQNASFLQGWKFVRPDDRDTPLEYTDFQPLLRNLAPKRLVAIFVSVLLERRFIFVARLLSTLCSVVQAAVALLYPLNWAHTFIPIVPESMVDICAAPVPYIVGMLSSVYRRVPLAELESDTVIVDIDNDCFLRPPSAADLALVPRKQRQRLVRLLGELAPQKPSLLIGNALLPRAFLGKSSSSSAERPLEEEQVDLIPPKVATDKLLDGFMSFFVALLRNYRCKLRPSSTMAFEFDKEAFVRDGNADMRPFLEQFCRTQMFEQFLAERARRYLPSSSSASSSSGGKFERQTLSGALVESASVPSPALIAAMQDQRHNSPMRGSSRFSVFAHAEEMRQAEAKSSSSSSSRMANSVRRAFSPPPRRAKSPPERSMSTRRPHRTFSPPSRRPQPATVSTRGNRPFSDEFSAPKTRVAGAKPSSPPPQQPSFTAATSRGRGGGGGGGRPQPPPKRRGVAQKSWRHTVNYSQASGPPRVQNGRVAMSPPVRRRLPLANLNFAESGSTEHRRITPASPRTAAQLARPLPSEPQRAPSPAPQHSVRRYASEMPIRGAAAKPTWVPNKPVPKPPSLS
jgi:DENN (AEX-3) domain/dDENN domain